MTTQKPTRRRSPRTDALRSRAALHIALPSRGLGSKAAALNLKPFGVKITDRLPADDRFRRVVLPAGWRGIPDDGLNMWASVVDQHGRTRAALHWEVRENGSHPLTFVVEVRHYVQAAIWGIEPLVLDQQWATRAEVLAAVQPKLDVVADQARYIEETRFNDPSAVAMFPLLVEEIHQFARFVETVKAAPEVAR